MKPELNDLPAPDTLVAATLYLMSRHALTACPLLGSMIARQLEYLARHPSQSVAPQLRAVCEKLSVQWAEDGDARRARRPKTTAGVAESKLIH